MCTEGCFGNYLHEVSKEGENIRECVAECPVNKKYYLPSDFKCASSCANGLSFSISGMCASSCGELYYKLDKNRQVTECTEQKCFWSKKTDYGYECISTLTPAAIITLYILFVLLIVVVIFGIVAAYLNAQYNIKICPCCCCRKSN